MIRARAVKGDYAPSAIVELTLTVIQQVGPIAHGTYRTGGSQITEWILLRVFPHNADGLN